MIPVLASVNVCTAYRVSVNFTNTTEIPVSGEFHVWANTSK